MASGGSHPTSPTLSYQEPEPGSPPMVNDITKDNNAEMSVLTAAANKLAVAGVQAMTGPNKDLTEPPATHNISESENETADPLAYDPKVSM
jgi:hypothetical protein